MSDVETTVNVMSPSRLPQLGQYEPTGWASSDELKEGEVRQGLKGGEEGAEEAPPSAAAHLRRGAPPGHGGDRAAHDRGTVQGVPEGDRERHVSVRGQGRSPDHDTDCGPRE